MNELEPHHLSFPLLGSRHLMRDLEDSEVQLDCRLCRFGREIVADERREFVSGFRQLRRFTFFADTGM